MKKTDTIKTRILDRQQLIQEVVRLRLKSKTIAFTNGVFDILHEGHIAVLSKAASFADILIVGINSDASVKKIKGEDRPVNNENSRALILASLIMVDNVVIFEEETPLEIIKLIQPDVLLKGGDYTLDTIVGAKEVIAHGGRVEIVPLLEGFSTTNIIKKFGNSK
ncbi:D-glycero-beta-D-manno-heptose 1-phosphate adenylyltransferase [Hanamia caeni]|jgi:D-beta-D-heptose 7-phosphate kinase/D-beta-D-heptose 1-phosphate adenosyltransferase|uniref:D-glycero-beta-D-manno-heptose 1-phosphate adenylyltransferase n=1 Tax=Hanamia caeni TaxID=2294116 RepID=A0A3M9NBR6_9BACT|nr:D-glycero-beta-D-manno-heptose 1-phosphate adenylyltransferase [Hanamia caeni]RNI35252.1 D-glycero-beta-D-manno-heptose 1-phosphate adenylyltransferase [Hanamia caeni]